MYIVFEGLDNSGKSTFISMVIAMLNADLSMPNVELVVEPGTTEVGKQIRQIVKHSGEKIDAITDRLLFMAARNQTLRNVVEPALENGLLVISDRSYLSTYAYQGFEHTTVLADMINVIVPDVVVYMTTPLEVCLSRRDGQFDRIEERDSSFYKEVQERYNIALKQLPASTAVWYYDGSSEDPDVIKLQIEHLYQSIKKFMNKSHE